MNNYLSLKFFILLGILLGLTMTHQAQELNGFVKLTSDYDFRGWSRSDRDPAVAVGLAYLFKTSEDTEFLFGATLASVNFEKDTSGEVSLSAGVATTRLHRPLSFELQLFQYTTDIEDRDYWEFTTLIWMTGDFKAGLDFSPAYLGPDGPSFFRPSIGINLNALGMSAVTVEAGWNYTDEDHFFTTDHNSYLDYKINLELSRAGLELSIDYVGTTIDDLDVVESRLVFSLRKNF